MLIHPGPADRQRIQVVRCHAHPVRLRLRAGLPLDRAIAAAVRDAGIAAAWLTLDDLRCDRLSFVIPAPPPGDGRVAFYSNTRTLGPSARIVSAGLHLGQGGDIHAHGLWTDAAEVLHMGHLRPEATHLSRDAWITGWQLDGAIFRRLPDAETGFSLFRPIPTRRRLPGGLPARLVRLRPNLDLVPMIAALMQAGKRVQGLGSLVGTQFATGAPLPGPATEILILDQDRTSLHVASVGRSGTVRQGVLSRQNMICITAELLLIDAHPSLNHHTLWIRKREARFTQGGTAMSVGNGMSSLRILPPEFC